MDESLSDLKYVIGHWTGEKRRGENGPLKPFAGVGSCGGAAGVVQSALAYWELEPKTVHGFTRKREPSETTIAQAKRPERYDPESGTCRWSWNPEGRECPQIFKTEEDVCGHEENGVEVKGKILGIDRARHDKRLMEGCWFEHTVCKVKWKASVKLIDFASHQFEREDGKEDSGYIFVECEEVDEAASGWSKVAV
jgi:hypothetical protein